MIDLRKLVDEPGYGKAATALQSAGMWDAHAGTGEPREFTVAMTALYTVHEAVKVTARNANEAEEKALAEFGNRHIRVGTIRGDDCFDASVGFSE